MFTKWVLIIILYSVNPAASPATMQVEFSNAELCGAAQKEAIRRIDEASHAEADRFEWGYFKPIAFCLQK